MLSIKKSIVVSSLLLLSAVSVYGSDIEVVQDISNTSYNSGKLNQFKTLTKKVAKNFLKYNNKSNQLGDEEILYHNGKVVGVLYNLKPSGYMITTLDKDEVPIKAYSYEDNYEDLPQEYQDFIKSRLNEYTTVVEKIRKVDPTFTSINRASWNKYEEYDPIKYTQEIVAEKKMNVPTFQSSSTSTTTRSTMQRKLTSTYWNQSSLYNYYTPVIMYDNVFQHTPVGCNAVTWGQIMYYHKWPYRSYGSSTYYVNGVQQSSKNIAKTYSWYTMSPDNNQVDELLFYIGVALKSNYSLPNTVASDVDAKYRIIDHFGYSTDMILIAYSYGSSTYTSFRNKIIDNINNSLPLYLSFYTSSEAHTAVIDGYYIDNYNQLGLQLNMGNSRSGYYVLSGNYLKTTDLFGQSIEDFSVLRIWGDIYPCSGNDCGSVYPY